MEGQKRAGESRVHVVISAAYAEGGPVAAYREHLNMLEGRDGETPVNAAIANGDVPM